MMNDELEATNIMKIFLKLNNISKYNLVDQMLNSLAKDLLEDSSDPSSNSNMELEKEKSVCFFREWEDMCKTMMRKYDNLKYNNFCSTTRVMKQFNKNGEYGVPSYNYSFEENFKLGGTVNCIISTETDMRSLLISGGDGVIKIWDLKSFEEVFTLTGHSGKVIDLVAYEKASKNLKNKNYYLFSGGADLTIRHWDLITGEFLQLFRCHCNQISRLFLIYINSEEYILSLSKNETFIWNLSTFARTDVSTQAGGYDGDQSLLKDASGCSIICDVRPSEVDFMLIDSPSSVKVLEKRHFTYSLDRIKVLAHLFLEDYNDGNYLMLSFQSLEPINSSDKKLVDISGVVVFDLATKQKILHFRTEDYLITKLAKAYTPEGNLLVYAANNRREVTKLLYQSENFELLERTEDSATAIEDLGSLVSILTVLPGQGKDHLILTITENNILRLTESASFNCANFPESEVKSSLFYQFNQENFLILGFDSGKIQVWKSELFPFYYYKTIHDGNINEIVELMRIPSERNLFASAAQDIVNIYDLEEGKVLKRMSNSQREIGKMKLVQLSNNKTYIICTYPNDSMNIYDFQTGRTLQMINLFTMQIVIYKKGNNDYLIARDSSSIFDFWDLKELVRDSNIQNYNVKCEPVKSEKKKDYFMAMHIEPHFFICIKNGGFDVYSIPEERVISSVIESRLLAGNIGVYLPKNENVFGSDVIIYSTNEMKIKFWNLQEHKLEVTLSGHFTQISFLLKVKVGKYNLLFSADGGGLIKVWNAADGKKISELNTGNPHITKLLTFKKEDSLYLISIHKKAFSVWLINSTHHAETLRGFKNFFLHQPIVDFSLHFRADTCLIGNEEENPNVKGYSFDFTKFEFLHENTVDLNYANVTHNYNGTLVNTEEKEVQEEEEVKNDNSTPISTRNILDCYAGYDQYGNGDSDLEEY